MKNRNEDKFGLIKDEDHQFNSIEEAGNYVKDLKGKLKRKASMEEFPISCSIPEQRLKYIQYGISLMTQKNLPFTKSVTIRLCRCILYGLSQGYTYSAMSSFLRRNGQKDATVKKIKEVEKEGLRLVKLAIERVSNTRLPIIGG